MASLFPSPINIPDVDIWAYLFERSSKPFPDDQPMFTCAATSRRYTFSDVRETAIQFGSALRVRWSWKKNDVLALFSPNCIDTPSITWGCHWAGGIVSPANPAYTVNELSHHLKDSDAKVLITQLKFLPLAIEAANIIGMPLANIVLIGEERDPTGQVAYFQDVLVAPGSGLREPVNALEDLAFLVYSSGTTGLPKGVMLTHNNLVSNIAMLESTEGTMLKWDKDKVLAVLPYYHIYGLTCLIHHPMRLGVETIVMPQFDINFFCSTIQKYRITYAYVAPPIVLHLGKSAAVDSYDLSSLLMITSGAAPLTKDLIIAVYKRLRIPVKQAYGLSETSPATHMQTWETWETAMGSVGPPLPNQTLRFVSLDGKILPRGSGKEGEMWVKGPNVFKGYHKNPKATALAKTKDGFFMTGDVGFEDANGNLYITDRVKELIKYKGSQVAPAELEGLLISHPMVDDVAVVGTYVESIATEVPLAFIVAAKDVAQNEASAKELIEWLGTRTASTKRLRGGVVWVKEIPKSASGKILRRVLKEMLAGPLENKAMGAVQYAAARSSL